MQLLYEEEGELKVGAVLSSAPASYQVESPHGRRTKIKSAAVLLSFEQPPGPVLLAEAQAYGQGIDTDFLWQCCGAEEFGFEELAREYVGRVPTPVEAAGVLVKLHSAPMYFYRRGRGRFRAAPGDTLKLALAGLEKKRVLMEKSSAWTASLGRFECPAEIAALKDELLYQPDRAKAETRAFEQACKDAGLTPVQLFARCGLLHDSHAYHFDRFLFEFYPHGDAFPRHELPPVPADLPLAEVEAVSLDDAGTTEIDDAFSVQKRGDDEWRIGIHIAAPGLAIAPGSPLDAIARERMSTAYMPGRKVTMLPEDVVATYSLDAGGARPAVSLYFTVAAADFAIRGMTTRIERVQMAANLRHAEHEALNDAFEQGRAVGLPHEEDLRLLWRFALAREKARGKVSVDAGMLDYNFRVEDGRVAIEPRRRGSPLDKLVSELMILANTTWGTLLAERDVAAIYRVQSTGKVRLSVHPEVHEGLGVSCYAWTSSPLRRYVDLVNQWQLLATVSGRRAPFARNSEGLLSALRAFEEVYARYDEHQRAMEHYWCLRWLLQEEVKSIGATVLREGLVRLAGLPLTTRIASLPELEPGTRVRIEIGDVDLLERTLRCTFIESLGKGGEGPASTSQQDLP
ncbi:MAG: RNB domain-containing ribonuclease [Betaproteobacteria bacterium]|nr:RNB domain-containing ribonuclease [Betaproteobacteria bacterium]